MSLASELESKQEGVRSRARSRAGCRGGQGQIDVFRCFLSCVGRIGRDL